MRQTSITRSSQPLVGIKQKRSIQDEKFVERIFSNHLPAKAIINQNPLAMPEEASGVESGNYAPTSKANIIIDARPLANAMAQRAMGAGTESTEHYRGCLRLFMGIENIHVMRDSLDKYIQQGTSNMRSYISKRYQSHN